MKSEKEKMIAGELYFSEDPELVAARKQARQRMKAINQEEDADRRRQQIEEAFAFVGPGSYLEPMISFDYGFNISIGKNFYANFNTTLLDVCPITIGDHCMFAPNVQLYTATHPIEPRKRKSGLEYGRPIVIGNNVWIGGNSVILPGVTLGDNVVVGAGSVVTKSFPENCVLAGNPAKIIRLVEETATKQSLAAEREKIDALDRAILPLLEQRMDVALRIARIKKEQQKQVQDEAREQEVLTNLQTNITQQAYEPALMQIYQSIMAASKAVQQAMLDDEKM